MRSTLRLAGAAVLAVALGACSDSSGPSRSGPQVQFNVATRAATSAGSVLAADYPPATFADSTDTLVITQVQMVVRELELKQVYAAGDTTPCAGDYHEGCEELESGPFLLDLPLSTGATTVMSVPVMPGTYGEFELKVRPPRSDSTSDFLAQHPDFAGVSIRVTGTWNGTDFTYETGLSASQEMEISPPLVVADSGSTDFTLFIDIGSWFRTAGGDLLDPATANAGGPNESLVNHNIHESFEAFEDENHDGCNDHQEGSGDGQHTGA
jgi:hypothetical protein